MPRGKLTNADEFAILDGIHARIPSKYLAEFLGVYENAVRERAKKLQGTEKQKTFLAYQEVYAEYDQQYSDYLFEDSNTPPQVPDDSDTGIDKVMHEFDLTKEEIRNIERKIRDLSEKCLLEYRKLRRTA